MAVHTVKNMSSGKKYAKKRRKMGYNATVYKAKRKTKVSVTRK